MKRLGYLVSLAALTAAAAIAGTEKKEAAAGSKEECKTTAAANGCCAGGDAQCCKMWEAMKGLEGSWVLTGGSEGAPAGGEIAVKYHVTSANSALVETLFPGTDHEMVTVYHMSGDNMTVTHYCAMGNQPFLKSTEDSKPGHVTFAFAGGENVDPKGEYMGALTVEIVDGDHFKQDWTHFTGGKAGDHMKFEFTRAAKS